MGSNKKPLILNFSDIILFKEECVERGLKRFYKQYNLMAKKIFNNLFFESNVFLKDERFQLKITKPEEKRYVNVYVNKNIDSENTNIDDKKDLISLDIQIDKQIFQNLNRENTKIFFKSLQGNIFVESEGYLLVYIEIKQHEFQQRKRNLKETLDEVIKKTSKDIKRKIHIYIDPIRHDLSEVSYYINIVGGFYMYDVKYNKLINTLAQKNYFLEEIF
jgi:hypothetical protein